VKGKGCEIEEGKRRAEMKDMNTKRKERYEH
jgi:hypothetical protein